MNKTLLALTLLAGAAQAGSIPNYVPLTKLGTRDHIVQMRVVEDLVINGQAWCGGTNNVSEYCFQDGSARNAVTEPKLNKEAAYCRLFSNDYEFPEGPCEGAMTDARYRGPEITIKAGTTVRVLDTRLTPAAPTDIGFPIEVGIYLQNANSCHSQVLHLVCQQVIPHSSRELIQPTVQDVSKAFGGKIRFYKE